MSLHAYSRCWLHLIWGTLKRQRLLSPASAAQLSPYLTRYAKSKGSCLKINFVNADPVHVLVDLPTGLALEDLMQLLKGSSAHWINEQNLVDGKFAWGRRYGAFSVSQSNVDAVVHYIAGQAEHRRRQSSAEEYAAFAKKHGLNRSHEEVE